jgi:hypothetical protein
MLLANPAPNPHRFREFLRSPPPIVGGIVSVSCGSACVTSSYQHLYAPRCCLHDARPTSEIRPGLRKFQKNEYAVRKKVVRSSWRSLHGYPLRRTRTRCRMPILWHYRPFLSTWALIRRCCGRSRRDLLQGGSGSHCAAHLRQQREFPKLSAVTVAVFESRTGNTLDASS